MTVLHELNRIAPAAADSTRGVRIDVDDLGRRLRLRHGDDVTLLDGVSFTLTPGELVAIVGPSGAGKTTLLETIAGVAPASSGSVAFDGVDVHANAKTFRGVLGYVPQDDIIHADLPLERTLRYAARLRLPSSTGAAEVNDAVSWRARRRRADRAGRRQGRLAEWRAAQARQHRRRATHRSARLLPG